MQATTMERSKLQALAAELAKDIRTAADLNALSRELLKLTVETAPSAVAGVTFCQFAIAVLLVAQMLG
ncbi:MAG: hypothetical protein RLZZ375_186 [Pseudomonadota bacterium]|jgi:hypothetical protein